LTVPHRRARKSRRTVWLTLALGIGAFLPFVLVFVQSSGHDNTPPPYVVTADWALPDSPNPTRVGLKGIEATMTLRDGRIATLLASDGAFFPRIKRLRIEKGVAVTTSDGYRLDTDAATIDADGRTLRTDGAVRAMGPVGSIRADSLEALDAEDRIVKFIGNVRVTIEAEQVKDSSALPK